MNARFHHIPVDQLVEVTKSVTLVTHNNTHSQIRSCILPTVSAFVRITLRVWMHTRKPLKTVNRIILREVDPYGFSDVFVGQYKQGAETSKRVCSKIRTDLYTTRSEAAASGAGGGYGHLTSARRSTRTAWCGS